MAREIKFRAWDKVQNKFLFPYPEGFCLFGETTCFDLISQQLTKSSSENPPFDRFNDLEITQFTGLKDKNGKDIYEGDYIKSDEWRYIFEVIFKDGSFQLFTINENEYFSEIGRLSWTSLEVLGNTFEKVIILNTEF